MVRGIIEFKCDKCGHHFKAPDVEWRSSVFSTPMPCPQCGSRHTYPNRFGIGRMNRSIYVDIWKTEEEMNGENKNNE